MKPEDVKIDIIGTIGNKLVLTDITPSYVYSDGKKTDTIAGYRYSIVCLEKGYKQLNVRIEGACRLDKPLEEDCPFVELEGLSISLCWSPNGHNVLAIATDIHVVDDAKVKKA